MPDNTSHDLHRNLKTPRIMLYHILLNKAKVHLKSTHNFSICLYLKDLWFQNMNSSTEGLYKWICYPYFKKIAEKIAKIRRDTQAVFVG